MLEKVNQAIREGISLRERLLELGPAVVGAVEEIIGSLQAGGKVLICGNGGSAADSQHIAAELIGRFRRERRALPAIALTTDTSILTSLSNDYDFDRVFARQIEALGKPGDILILISTSGNSANLLRALEAAERGDLQTIALLGRDGGKLAGRCGRELIVPAEDTARIQEGQVALYHIICDLVEEAFA